MNNSNVAIKEENLFPGSDSLGYRFVLTENISAHFTAKVLINGSGCHTTDKKYIEISISVSEHGKPWFEQPKLTFEQIEILIKVSNEFLQVVKNNFKTILSFKFDDSLDFMINHFKVENKNDFPNGTIKLVSVEESTKTEVDTEELETRFCSLCGMPFTVHPVLEQHTVFCNFCTMHDIRSI